MRPVPPALFASLLLACGGAPPGSGTLPAGAPAGEPQEADVPLVVVEPDTALGDPELATSPQALSSLQQALAAVDGPVELRLRPGRYELRPQPYTDPTCGNCQEAATPVPATVGARVATPGVRIVGSGPEAVVIRTHAGYGLLFDGCDGCVLEGVTVTGGVRDPDGHATDGAVVVRNGRVDLRGCVIRDNIGDSATVAGTVVGIAGVVGREGSDIRIDGCHILRNSWDGVALYRGARAEVINTVVDGVDAARGGAIGGGRGVGIGATWDARAIVRGTLVRSYWKGIGAFVDAEVDARENIIEDILTWGLAYWGPDGGQPAATFRDNVIFRTGACGASVDRSAAVPPGEDPGALVGNLFVATGQDPRYDTGEPYCWQRAIARHAVPSRFEIEGNLVHDAREPGDAWPTHPQISRNELLARTAPLLERLAERPALAGSAFFREFVPR